MTTQTHSTSSSDSQPTKFEQRRAALATHKAEVDAANKAHRAALNAANAKYQATLAALNSKCCHPNAELVGEWVEVDSDPYRLTDHNVDCIRFTCPDCGHTWVETR